MSMLNEIMSSQKNNISKLSSIKRIKMYATIDFGTSNCTAGFTNKKRKQLNPLNNYHMHSSQIVKNSNNIFIFH
jgi:hypothetical protein